MPQATTDGELAKRFADFFMYKISRIRQTLNDFQSFKPQLKQVQCFDKFEDLTESDVKRLISELNTKSCELDLVPTCT